MSTLKFWIILGLIFVALTWLAILDVARRDFGSTNKKMAWGCVALIPFVGFVVYFIVGRGRGKTEKHPAESPANPDAGD